MSAIPNPELVRAALDGHVVQYRRANIKGSLYADLPPGAETIAALVSTVNPELYEFRLKPTPITQWRAVWPGGLVGEPFPTKDALLQDAVANAYEPGFKALRLELDPTTLDATSTTEDVDPAALAPAPAPAPEVPPSEPTL